MKKKKEKKDKHKQRKKRRKKREREKERERCVYLFIYFIFHSSNSGGYHAIAIPLSDSTRSNLSDFKSGNVNYVQLVRKNLILNSRTKHE